jgi:hypothetical protein
MSNATQGPGWWQASDGNWYPPEQHPSYAPPPPTASSAPPGYRPTAQPTGTPVTPVGPQSWSAPPAAPQYPAPAGYPAPGGQTFGNAQTAFTAGVAKAPLAAWLLVGGFVVALISLFLPAVTASFGGQTASGSLWSEGGVAFVIFFVLVAGAVLSVTAFVRPQGQRRTLTVLTVLIGLLAIQLIYNWFTYDSQMAEVKRDNPDISDVNFSPGFGLFLYTAAIVFLAVRIVMLWRGRSKAQSQTF